MDAYERDREQNAIGPDEPKEELMDCDPDLLYDAWRDCQDEDADKKFKQRVAEVLLRELSEPERWHYVSFADEVFRGVVIIKAHGITDAVRLCHALNINPSGQVLGVPMPDEVIAQVPETHRMRLLSKAEVQAIWADAKTIREFEAEETC